LHEARLRLLQRLSRGDGTVTDLMRHVAPSQPLISWHPRQEHRHLGLADAA
jgi:hypothetical protein